jgi:hypothetical protein
MSEFTSSTPTKPLLVAHLPLKRNESGFIFRKIEVIRSGKTHIG